LGKQCPQLSALAREVSGYRCAFHGR
jgi:hypothetical protein